MDIDWHPPGLKTEVTVDNQMANWDLIWQFETVAIYLKYPTLQKNI